MEADLSCIPAGPVRPLPHFTPQPEPAAEISSHSQDPGRKSGGWPEPETLARAVTSRLVPEGGLLEI